ncbi:MOSC domain-containing protein [Salisediminibacterium beveridgei]|uniref:MOSC domain-containing protein n=1 Tax=Salisediminibacterium beveridgei TaxID=632773 RepID=UPI0018DBCCF2|nr:MOSC domain-containing protein [Salisediminibacterium beveridgei]
MSTVLAGQVKQMAHAKFKTQTWSSAICKEAVDGPVWIGALGLSGDEVADRENHGGPDKAVFAYPSVHYDFWATDLPEAAMGMGAMGENLAICGMDETQVYIGDRYQIGDALLQVAQPRQPCWKPAYRYGQKTLTGRILATGRTGWYFRVLTEGDLKAGQAVLLMERPNSTWTVAKCHDLLHAKSVNPDEVRELSQVPFLAERLKRELLKRLNQ